MTSFNTVHDSAQLEPLKQWPARYERTPSAERRSSQFQQAGILDRTLQDLRHELRQMDVEDVIVQVEVSEDEIRVKDGMPYKRADIDPGVVLTLQMEDGSVQTYPCDTFTSWTENLRAVTLALRDLRRISRYGVGQGSEQYRGFTALPENVDDRLGPEEAAKILVSTAGWRSVQDYERRVESCLESEDQATAYLRSARKRSHPDVPGGTEEQFKRVNRAGEILRQYHQRPKAVGAGQEATGG